MSDDELVEQLQAELKQVFDATRVAPGSSVAAVRSAHRRRRRRRSMLTGAAAVAVLAGGTVAVRQVRTDDSLATGASGPGDAAAEPVAELSVAGTTAAPSSPPPATVIDSPLVWADVTPAAGDQAGPSWSGEVPGVVVVSQDGRSELWWTADGIEFARLAADPPSGDPARWYARGELVVGAGAEVDSRLMVDVSTDRGVTWSTVALPVDPHALDGLDHVVPFVSTAVLPTDGVPLVTVTMRADLDPSGIAALDGVGSYLMDESGVTVFAGGCGQPIEGNGVDETTSCDATSYTWDELGVAPAAAAALISPTSRVFDVSGSTAVEVAAPDGYVGVYAAERDVVGATPVTEGQPEGLFRYVGGAWQAVIVPEQIAGSGAVPSTAGDRTFALVAEGLYSDGEAGPTVVGLGPLVDAARIEPVRLITTPTGAAITAQVRVDALAEGPIEVESGGVVVRRTGQAIDWFVLDQRGAPITGATIEPGEPGRGFRVVAADGSQLASFDEAAYQRLLAAEPIETWVVLTTQDGRSVAVDDLAGVLGIDGGEITSVDLHAAGERLIATVGLSDGTMRTAATE